MEEVAVYSGSFNPLHIGHLAIMRHLTMLFDKILLVVSPKNPLKEIDADSAGKRLDDARDAVERHPELGGKVIVSDIEFTLPLPNYTINTLRALDCDGKHLTLVMGGDQIADIRRWKDYREILTDFGVAVYPRDGFNLEEIRQNLIEEDSSYRIRILDAPEVTISSTFIREGLSQGDDMDEWLM